MGLLNTLFGGKYPLVGVDISDKSIELLQVKSNKQLKTSLRKELEPGLIVQGEIKKIDKLAKVLETAFLVAQPKFFSRDCLLSLPDKQTFFLVFDLPNDVGDLAKAVYDKAKEILPLELKNAYYDYLVTKQKKDSREIFFAAAQKDIVDQYLELFSKAKLNLEIIDFESACLARALLSEEIKEPVFIVDLGAKSTDVVLLDGYGFRDQINIPIAGYHLTKKIAEKLNLDMVAAGKLKRSKGLMIKEKNIGADLNKILENIFIEIKRMADNYQQKNNKQVKDLILVGGSSQLKGLTQLFTKSLPNIKIVIGEADKSIDLSKQKLAGNKMYYSNAIGLALRGSSQQRAKQGLNLIANLK